MTPITNSSEQPAEYAQALTEADTLEKLVATVRSWRELAFDAFEVVSAMTEDDFAAFRIGLLKERAGEFAGEKFARKYGALTQPEILFTVAVYAHRFNVPWGYAYLRLKETGTLRTIQKERGA